MNYVEIKLEIIVIGNTPRQQQRGRGNKQNTSHITSRVIGVEVHCGPIHGTLLYYTDDMSRGGSSTIIEVTRQGNYCIINLYYMQPVTHPVNVPHL